MKSIIKSYMKQKEINKYVFLITAVIYFATGLLLAFNDRQLLLFIPYILLATAAYTVMTAIFRLIQNKKSALGKVELFAGAASLILIIFSPEIAGILLSILITVWCFLIGFVRLVTAFLCKKDRTKGVISNVLMGVFMVAVGIVKITVPKMDFPLLARFVGIYLCIYAVTQFDEFITQCVHTKRTRLPKRRIRFSLPSFITAFLPLNFVKEMRSALYDGSVEPEDLTLSKERGLPDMEVLIHTTDIWPSMGGHVDISFGDRVISYGNYDDASMYLIGTAGEGVLESIKREPYINFCVTYSKKIIIGYGLKLSEDEKNLIKKAIDELFEQTIPWEPPAKAFENKKQPLAMKEATDYASELYKATDAEFFKFKTGSRYKSYFGLYMNCARVADEILGHLGLDKISFNGIFSPGSYLNFLNNEFLRKDSIIISKTIYSTQTILKLT